MRQNNIPELLMGVLSAYLTLFLFLSALGFYFAFIINWEDWFFGIKLDGWPAGVYLIVKAITASLLVVLLLKYPRKSAGLSAVSVLFFAIVYILPVFSQEKNLGPDYGWTVFWMEFIVFLGIPAIFLTCQVYMNRYAKGLPE